MKKFIALTQIVSLFILLFQPVLAQQGQKIGNITGVVYETKQENGDKSWSAAIKSDVPFNEIEWKLIGNFDKMTLPEGWKAKKDGDKIILTGFPTYNFKARFSDYQDSSGSVGESLLKEITWAFRFESTSLDERTFQVKPADPTNSGKLNEVVEFPEIVRVGTGFIITFKDGFDGKLSLKIGDKVYEEYRDLPEIRFGVLRNNDSP